MQKYQNRCHFKQKINYKKECKLTSVIFLSLTSPWYLSIVLVFFFKGCCHSDTTEPEKLSQLFIIRD